MPVIDDLPPQDAPQPHRGRPRDPARDARILEAAVALVAELGYDRTTVDGIAERAGVSKPTVYRRWPGKREIVVEAIRCRKGPSAPADTGDLRDDLLAVVRGLCESMNDENAHMAAGLTSLLRSSDEFAALFREHVIAVERARYGILLERAVERGELPAGPACSELFADVAPAIVFNRVMISHEPVDAAFAEELVDRILLPILRTAAPAPGAGAST